MFRAKAQVIFISTCRFRLFAALRVAVQYDVLELGLGLVFILVAYVDKYGCD